MRYKYKRMLAGSLSAFAMTLSALSLEAASPEILISNSGEEMSNIPAPLAEVLVKRHSGRSYNASMPVTEDKIYALIEAARIAPSCYNDQPWYFLICNKATHPEAYNKVFDTLAEGNQAWAKNAPVLIVVLANSKFHRDGKPNRWGQYDSGAAAISMMLEAASLGLMAHQMGGFDENKIAKSFSIPNEFTPMAVMTIGYEAAGQEVPAKSRKPIKENFFNGSWNQGFK